MWDLVGWYGMAWDSVGRHGVVWGGVGRHGPRAQHRLRGAEPSRALQEPSVQDGIRAAELSKSWLKPEHPHTRKPPLPLHARAIFFVSLQMFNILIKDLRFFFSFESDFGYLSLQELLSLWPSPVMPFSTSKG